MGKTTTFIDRVNDKGCDGLYQYFEDDVLIEEGMYNQGTQVGVWFGYYESGGLKYKAHYDKQGRRTGVWSNWCTSGAIFSKVRYKKDMSVWSEWYYENRQIAERIGYKDDRVLKIEKWDENGTLIRHIEYDDDGYATYVVM